MKPQQLSLMDPPAPVTPLVNPVRAELEAALQAVDEHADEYWKESVVNSCLNCRWLRDDHGNRMAGCLYPLPVVPEAFKIVNGWVYPSHPFYNCPTWEGLKEAGKGEQAG